MAAPVSHEVAEVSFGFYTESEIRRLSTAQITSVTTYDRLGNPLPGGLYDPAMGPIDGRSVCITCGLSSRDCPGHLGYFVLCQPLYHPLLFNIIYQALRVKCFRCHSFRLSSFTCRLYALKLRLLDAGKGEDAELVDDKLANSENSDSFLRSWEQRISTIPAMRVPSGKVKAQRRMLVREFLQATISCKSCDRCQAPRTTIRKDGFSKFFIKRNKSAACLPRSALETVRHQAQTDEAADLELDDSAWNRFSESEDENEDLHTQAGELPDGRQQRPAHRADKYLHPADVEAHLRLLWGKQSEFATLLWGDAGADVAVAKTQAYKFLFWRVLPIAPSRFRPPSRATDGSLAEHPQNHNIHKIMLLNERLKKLVSEETNKDFQNESAEEAAPRLSAISLSGVLGVWIDLQNAVNTYVDSSMAVNSKLAGATTTPGIRQTLERKEGIFRMHMMGKRVNFACRSEIGLPIRFAKTLTYPQHVTPLNVVQLRLLVTNGPEIYPGANYVEDVLGRQTDLKRMDVRKRRALAARLLTPPGQKVWRHLQDGDMVLMNRQPTLHKPGIMAHRARVLLNPAEQTIRMHYANCNTYNADFDGDEMNCHFPQDEISRAEAEIIASTDEQYISPTHGRPLRGLIQDHIATGVKLTSRDYFLPREQFQHILYQALVDSSSLPGGQARSRITTPAPAIWKPVAMWTGKQLVSALLRHLTAGRPQLSMDFRAKTSPSAFGPGEGEEAIVIRGGELLNGVLDKAAFGASEGGLVHGVYEFYGADFAGQLLTSLGRLFTVALQFAGHTCGIEDLILTDEAEAGRRAICDTVETRGAQGMQCFLDGEPYRAREVDKPIGDVGLASIMQRTSKVIEQDLRTGTSTQQLAIDNFMRAVLAPVCSDMIRACLPDGLEKRFPENCFSLMVLTGAKGSSVNQSQVCCSLGQQELEGRRVPLMPSGKSLPSFRAFHPSPRAYGFIVDRFLTGIRPQEYYFHCMAGREGLIDTAVKTSRSGYLQRCLVKGLEELRVHYDHSVRDAEGNLVQLLYGDDGIDPTQSHYLEGTLPKMKTLVRNYAALLSKYAIDKAFLQRTGLDLLTAQKLQDRLSRAQEQAQAKAPIKVGSIVHARRLKRGRVSWVPGAWLESWHACEVVRVYPTQAGQPASFDVRYESGELARGVPQSVPLNMTEPAAGLMPVSGTRLEVIRSHVIPDPVLAKTRLGHHLGAVSEKFQDAIQSFLIKFANHKTSSRGSDASLKLLLWLKYARSLAVPGEAVGAIAAQSIGEPSTQMTLNTFHLAGHGGANVTLGIPRMREIIMTASQRIKTPSMTIPLQSTVSPSEAQRAASLLRRLHLNDFLQHENGILVTERLRLDLQQSWERCYGVKLRLYEEPLLQEVFGLSYAELHTAMRHTFVHGVLSAMMQELKRVLGRRILDISSNRAREERQESLEETNEEEAVLEVSDKPQQKAGDPQEEEEEDEQEGEEALDDDEAQGTLLFGREKEQGDYGADDPGQESQHGGTLAAGELLISGRAETEIVESQHDSVRGRGESEGQDPPEHDSEAANLPEHPFLEDMTLDSRNGIVDLTLKTKTAHRRLLMVQLIENVAKQCTIRACPGISEAFVVEDRGGGERHIQTSGCNLHALWNMPEAIVDHAHISINDIWAVHQTYGVEAARSTIVSEIQSVFGVYGIVVDPRHLGLLADFMTYQGGYRPLNRIGMQQVSSPFLQMSFETTTAFLTDAARTGAVDLLTTPSAKLAVGQPAGIGTGCMDLLIPVPILSDM